MAYVAITKDLVRRLDTYMLTLMEAELGKLPKVENARLALAARGELQQVIDTHLWGDATDLRDRLVKYNRKAEIRVGMSLLVGGYSHRLELLRAIRTDVPCVAPLKYAYYADHPHVELELKSTDDVICSLPETQKLEEALYLRKECQDRWDKVKKQMTTFVEQCKSLNEAVKLFPDLRRYLNKNLLERLDAKVTKTKSAESDAAKALASLDVEALNASTVLARMAGAKL